MDTSEKKILHLTNGKEDFEQIKRGEKKKEILAYNQRWKEKLIYPCGTYKKYNFIQFQCETSQMLVEFKEIRIVKEKKSWLRSEKKFEIELGKVVFE